MWQPTRQVWSGRIRIETLIWTATLNIAILAETGGFGGARIKSGQDDEKPIRLPWHHVRVGLRRAGNWNAINRVSTANAVANR